MDTDTQARSAIRNCSSESTSRSSDKHQGWSRSLEPRLPTRFRTHTPNRINHPGTWASAPVSLEVSRSAAKARLGA